MTLDTNIIIAYLKGEEEVASFVDATKKQGLLFLPATVEGEFLSFSEWTPEQRHGMTRLSPPPRCSPIPPSSPETSATSRRSTLSNSSRSSRLLLFSRYKKEHSDFSRRRDFIFSDCHSRIMGNPAKQKPRSRVSELRGDGVFKCTFPETCYRSNGINRLTTLASNFPIPFRGTGNKGRVGHNPKGASVPIISRYTKFESQRSFQSGCVSFDPNIV